MVPTCTVAGSFHDGYVGTVLSGQMVTAVGAGAAVVNVHDPPVSAVPPRLTAAEYDVPAASAAAGVNVTVNEVLS